MTITSNTLLSVDKIELNKIYQSLIQATQAMELILADIGCIHLNKVNITTMDGSGLRRFYCPDCNETIEEEITNGLEIR